MEQNITSLAYSLAIALQPYVPIFLTKAAGSLGEQVPNAVKEIWGLLKPRFEKKERAAKVLTELAQSPESEKELSKLEWQINNILVENQELVSILSKIMEKLENEKSATSSISNLNSNNNINLESSNNNVIVSSGAIQININEKKNEVDPQSLLYSYLNRLYETTRQLNFTGTNPSLSEPYINEQISLEDIYIELFATSRIEKRYETAAVNTEKLSVASFFQSSSKLVLLGDPGSGKSTFINFLVMCYCRNMLGKPQLDSSCSMMVNSIDEFLVPIHVTLRDFAAKRIINSNHTVSVKDLLDYIIEDLKDSGLDEFGQQLRSSLFERGAILLLDGLDEVPEVNQTRFQIKNIIEEFAKIFPGSKIIVSCRTYAYQKQNWKLGNFAEAVISPLDGIQISRFIDKWFMCLSKQRGGNADDFLGKAEILKSSIRENKSLFELATRPLLLTLIISLHVWRGGSLPDKREEIYAATIELLLEYWEKPKVVRDANAKILIQQPSLIEWMKIDKQQLRSSLEELAFTIHLEQGSKEDTADIDEIELLRTLMPLCNNSEILANPTLLISYLIQRAGLIITRGVGIYTFPHRTIQEYLAACYLTNNDYPYKLAELTKKEPEKWSEVALLAGAKAGRGSMFAAWALIQNLLPDDSQIMLPASDSWNYLLASQAAIETVDLKNVRGLDKNTLEKIKNGLYSILEHGDLPPKQRAQVGRNLGKIGDFRDGIDPLLSSIDNMEFCYVPAGDFIAGGASQQETNIVDYGFYKDKYVCDLLKYDYWIAKYHISVAQYSEFIRSTGYQTTNIEFASDIRNHPVRLVSWQDVVYFCQWLNNLFSQFLPEDFEITIPSEVEWEKGARGGILIPDKEICLPISKIKSIGRTSLIKNELVDRIYPWGNDFSSDYLNSDESMIGDTTALGCFSQGTSPYGAQDMCGNLWVWTRSLWGDSPQKPDYGHPYARSNIKERIDVQDETIHSVRGGSYGYSGMCCQIGYRGWEYPKVTSWDLGVRLVIVPKWVLNSVK